jgi:hypothetical protein
MAVLLGRTIGRSCLCWAGLSATAAGECIWLAAAGQGGQEALAGGLCIARRRFDAECHLEPLAHLQQGLQVGRQVRVARGALVYPGPARRDRLQAVL